MNNIIFSFFALLLDCHLNGWRQVTCQVYRVLTKRAIKMVNIFECLTHRQTKIHMGSDYEILYKAMERYLL